MNPFLWTGPKFLGFYAILIVAAVVAVAIRWNMGGRGKTPSMSDLTNDPYGIAYIRGNTAEAIRVAIFNLVDRGILSFSEDRIRQSRTGGAQLVKRPLEKALVAACAKSAPIKSVARNPDVLREAGQYGETLGKAGLVADREERAGRMRFGFAVAGVLLAVAVIKFMVAVSQGRTNVGFLILLTIIAWVLVIALSANRKTHTGQQALRDLRTLMKRAKANASRLQSGGKTNEAVLLAAVFGLYILPAAAFPQVEQMYPRPSGGGDSGGSSDSGSSCSSGCGGGGGCGGCGG